MGANNFVTTAEGKTPREAFNRAGEDARYEYGHRGYTGTIAEVPGFSMVAGPPPGEDPIGWAWDQTIDNPRFQDKWGPCGCFRLGEGRYCFFGWASS